MKTSLILHGWGGDSKNSWFPWLSESLNSRIHDIYIPNLPSTNNPILEEQLDYINIYSSDFKDGGNIIGHSLGCKLALKFVEENNIKNSNLVLVASSYPGLADDLGEEIYGDSYNYLKLYFDEELDFEKLNSLNNKYIFFWSDNDVIDIAKAKRYFKKLKGVKFVEFKDKGHFNSSAGVLELPEILEYVE